MTTEDFKRKLTAILSADAVGYSRLMGEDEDSTVRTLTAYRKLISSLIEKYDGRVVDSPGDNLLSEFESIRDAVQCADGIQEELRIKNIELPTNRQMKFRIGIHTGDIIKDGGRIYGDGVNVASRIESLADPGGICISRTAYDQVKSKIDIDFEYLGEYEVKNIKDPVRVYKINNKKSEMKKAAESSSQREKPSIVVLPFANISGDPEQEYFSDGMTEEIINALANVEGLKVISRTSSFFFQGKDVSLRTIGAELNVDNVIEGSVRKAGNKIRITAQLIKVTDDTHLWSETYDRELEDVFAIQDEISKAIVDSLKIRLFGKEKEPLIKTYTENIDAYEAYIKGRYYYQSFMKGGMEKALDYYNQAITIDLDFAPAYSAIAEYYVFFPTAVQGKITREEFKFYKEEARKAINTALEIDDNLPEAHANLGLIKLFFEWDWEGAEKAFETAISLNPGFSKPHYDYAQYLCIIGKTDQAILEARKAVGLDPLSGIPHSVLGVVLCVSGQFDKALRELIQAREMLPGYVTIYVTVASTYIMREMFEEAMAEINKGLKLFPGNLSLLCLKARINAQTGEKGKARKILDDLLEKSKEEYLEFGHIALLCIDLGEINKALECLEETYDMRNSSFFPFKWFFPRSLNNDPQFDAFFKKIGL